MYLKFHITVNVNSKIVYEVHFSYVLKCQFCYFWLKLSKILRNYKPLDCTVVHL